LRRPLPGTPFRRTIEGIAKGLSGRGLGGIPRSELLTRAARLLQWLDGKESDGKNPYEVLGLSYSATSAQIHHRYRTLSKRVHPDRHPPSRQDYWRVRQQEVNEAYRMLSDPKSRGQYLARVEERAKLLRRLWQMERARRR
jgi:DnaJ-domain-containing protein 1